MSCSQAILAGMRNKNALASPNRLQRSDARLRTGPKAMRLLEVAGQVFADQGFERATGKEICERAGMNAAAINYYFGGMEGLYVEVLVEAKERLFSTDDLLTLIAGENAAEARLRKLMEVVVTHLSGDATSSWMYRVLGRELISPSPLAEIAGQWQIAKRLALMSSMVGEIMGAPPDHPAVRLGMLNVIGPIVLLFASNAETYRIVVPQLELRPEFATATADYLTAYAIAGLKATARLADSMRDASFARAEKANDSKTD